MSNDTSLELDAGRSRPREATDIARPDTVALGIIGDPDHLGDIARAIVRGKQHGLYPIVVANERAEELIAVATDLGARIVDVDESLDRESAETHLAGAAKSRDLEGIVCLEPPVGRIDIGRSVTALDGDDTYIVDAIPTEQTQSPEVLVGIPAYNEAETIEEVVSEVTKYGDEVLVVDDGSTDGTKQLAEEAGATVVAHSRNRGYGNALRTIFKEAAKRDADHLAILDADGQHQPDNVPDLVSTLDEREADIAIGSRFANGGDTNAPLYRRFGLFVVNTLTNVSLGVVRPRSWVSDTQSGFRVYNNEAIEAIADNVDEIGGGMDASTDILYQAHREDLDVIEEGVHIDYKVANGSHRHPVRHGFVLVSNLLRTIETERPITLVGIPGVVSILIGIGFAYWALSMFVRTGVFPNGVAIVAIAFGLLGTFATFTAIILHALNTKFDS